MTVRIRPAGESDLDVIVALNHALFQEDAGQRDPYMNLNWARQEGRVHFARHLASPASCCLVADRGGEVVGYLVGYSRSATSLTTVPVGDLESIFVLDNARCHGVGEHLVDAFLAWCRGRGAQRVSVTAHAANDGAIRFYQRAGFETRQLTLERPV